MNERPPSELPEGARLTAVVIGAVVGIVLVLVWVLGLGLVETAVILLPMSVLAAVAYGFYAWARRRGDL